MDLDRYVALRPVSYHTTSADNLPLVRATGALICAERLLAHMPAGRLSERRKHHWSGHLDERTVVVRDQEPLHAGSIAFEPGWDIARLVRRLNQLVYFWPGTARGPIDYGERHHARYRERERLVTLRVGTRALLDTNPSRPLFSRYNSGAPRVTAGRKSPRGAATFLHAAAFPGRPSEVVELVFEERVALPMSATEIAESLDGPWLPLRTS